MKIDGTNPLINLSNGVQRVDNSQASGRVRKDGEVRPDSDRLELSIQSREISHLAEMIRSTPDVREDRVDQVRREIEGGTYNVKAEKIAEKILGGDLLDEIF